MDPVIGAALIKAGTELIPQKSTTNASGSSSQLNTQRTVSKKNISQEGINKLIYDALSADSGLASLATGENLSGGYGASTKALLSQDFMVKLIGELANVTAETVSDTTGTAETKQQSTSTTKKGLTVICTELHRQGLLSSTLYNHPTASAHLAQVHPYTLAGYHLWAVRLVPLMKKSPLLSHILLPICKSRYEMIISGRTKFWGAVTLYLGHPICWALGALSNLGAAYAIAS